MPVEAFKEDKDEGINEVTVDIIAVFIVESYRVVTAEAPADMPVA